MMNYRISQSQLAKMEEEYKLVDSKISKNVTVGIRRDKEGFKFIDVSKNSTYEIEFHRDIIPFLREALEIWDHLADGVSFDSLHPEKKLRIVR